MGDCGFISVLESRRSVRPTMFSDLGPTSDELERIVRVALRAPDHKKLAPWRFVVFQGGSRAQFGEVMAAACVAEEDGDRPSEVRLKTERERFMRAPVVVAAPRASETAGAVDLPSMPCAEVRFRRSRHSFE